MSQYRDGRRHRQGSSLVRPGFAIVLSIHVVSRGRAMQVAVVCGVVACRLSVVFLQAVKHGL